MSSSTPLPSTMRALVSRNDKFSVEQVPTPEVTGGSVVVQIITNSAASVAAAAKKVLPLPSSFTAGSVAVGRVAITSPDTTSLQPGQLVIIDPHIRARDEPFDANILLGLCKGMNEQSNRFMESNYLGGACAEYARVPLENTHAVNEELLLGANGLGYAAEDLAYIPIAAVVYGGLRAIDLHAGESIVVAPATGAYSGGAVKMALAMGAHVIAVSRNVEAMEKLKEMLGSERLVTVQQTSNVEETTSKIIAANYGRPVDAFFDISPPASSGSPHLKSCTKALKVRGNVALMGFTFDHIPIPYGDLMFKQLTIRGVYMYERQELRDLIRMVERGIFKLGKKGGIQVAGRYKMEEFEKAIGHVETRFAPLEMVYIEP